MSLYPSLEDMKFDHLAKAQMAAATQQQQRSSQPVGALPPPLQNGAPVSPNSTLYPSLSDYMGMEISAALIQQNMPQTGQEVMRYGGAGALTPYAAAPITGEQNLGLMRAQVKDGVRQVVACKGADGKVGMRVQHINKGVFVSLVQRDSPAAVAGLRFGDQILQINGVTLAGYDRDKVMSLIKKASPMMIEFAIRDRPFERTLTMQKDSQGHVGFIFKDGKITSIVKDSSAARNGLLIEHNMLEVNGQNVVGLKDKDISEILSKIDRTITLTIMPSFIYEHMVKCMADNLVKKTMDHSIPDL